MAACGTSKGLVWQYPLCSSVPGHLPPCHTLLTCQHILLLVHWTFHPISSYTWYCSPSSDLLSQVSKHISLCELFLLLCMCDSSWPCQLPWSHRQNSCTFYACLHSEKYHQGKGNWWHLSKTFPFSLKNVLLDVMVIARGVCYTG